jgi:hypothetical protein
MNQSKNVIDLITAVLPLALGPIIAIVLDNLFPVTVLNDR